MQQKPMKSMRPAQYYKYKTRACSDLKYFGDSLKIEIPESITGTQWCEFYIQLGFFSDVGL